MSQVKVAPPTPAGSTRRPSPATQHDLEKKREMKPAQFSIGIVKIKEGQTPAKGRPFYELRFKDPATGLEVKRRISGLELDEIRRIAKDLNNQAQIGKGHLASQPTAPCIEDGLIEAIALTNTRENVKAEQIRQAKCFTLWMTGNYPAVRTWDQLRPVMVNRYVASMEQGEAPKAYDTVRMALAPVKLAWRVMHENWPELVRPMPRFKLTRPPWREIECLEAAEVAILLDWMKAHSPNLWPIACLQGL